MSRRGSLLTGPDAAVSTEDREPATLRGWLWGAVFHHWGTKLTALGLALLVFVMTRDEIHRTFTVPLVVLEDPARVLLTDLPDTVEVEVRGPWTRLSQLSTHDLGSATFSLHDARPGPLKLDPSSIVMPKGVILVGIDHEPVDLRFETVEARERPRGE